MHRIDGRVEMLLAKLDGEPRGRYLVPALFLLLALILFPTSWNGNEEHYLPLAYRRVAGGAFSEFHAVFDAANARFMFEYLMGGLIAAVGYEAAHTLGRLGMAAVYAAAFAVFFRAVGLSVLDALGAISLFCLAGQQLMGWEWLFDGIEGKTFAYAAVAAAVGCGWAGRWMLAAVLGAVGTYFHFLVGGFWALSLGLLALIRTNQPALVARVVGLFAALCIPLAVVIIFDRFGHELAPLELNPDRIYALRGAHHVLPFDSLARLWSWSGGIAAAGALTGAFWLLAKRGIERDLSLFVLILLVYLLAALGISFLDRHTYYLSKFYLFRPSSFTLLLALTTASLIVRRSGTDETLLLARRLALAVVVVVFTWGQVHAKVDDYRAAVHRLPRGFAELVAAIERESRPDEIVLVEPGLTDPMLENLPPRVAMPRLLPRPTLVSYKFPPTDSPGLVRWQRMIDFRYKVFRNGCTEPLEYPVRTLMVFESRTLPTVKSCGTVIWESNSVALVRVDERWLARAPQGGSAGDKRDERR